jgi:hypothetical protein
MPGYLLSLHVNHFIFGNSVVRVGGRIYFAPLVSAACEAGVFFVAWFLLLRLYRYVRQVKTSEAAY